MRWIRLLFRVFGWLLTPLLAWAASFFGAVGGALAAMRMDDPVRGLIVTAAFGGLAGFLAIIGWLKYLRHSPEVREALAVTEDGTPDTTELQVAALLMLGTVALAAPAEAQTLGGGIGQFYEEDRWTSYRAGFTASEHGLLGVQIHGDLFRRADGADGRLAGLGLDVRAPRSGRGGPYAVVGLGAGLGSEVDDRFSDTWLSWSAGAGYQVFPASFLSLGLEGRWRGISLGKRNGVELAVGLGLHFGGRRGAAGPKAPGTPALPVPSPRSPSPAPAVPPGTPVAATLADSIVATATAAMGRPYKYGGTGADSGGFDCSGLIQYAFGAHGIALPRRSTEQARQGREVPKRLDGLLPGDLLTFSNGGGAVTHVGLYLGDGRFVHSATRGVQVSILSGDDPYGRWWYKRWVGVRRIIG
jgi:murein DD-endopeptidase